MIWVPDKTGRFPQRPHYKLEELDYTCQDIVTRFLEQKYGKLDFPISTDDLTVMIERDTSDLDLFADLSTEGNDVEGATDFFTDKKPAVLITNNLSSESRRENRLRTTLGHEYGHVKFHDFLWKTYRPKLIPSPGWERGPRCNRDTITTSSKIDWLEWQASYASGAFLMPITQFRNVAGQFLKNQGYYQSLRTGTTEAESLIQHVATMFDVSTAAAQVRLSQQKYLSHTDYTIPLFNI